MLNKEAVTMFFKARGVIYVGTNEDRKLSVMTALEECGMDMGFDFRTRDLSRYNYIFYVGEVHMKGQRDPGEVAMDADEFLSMCETDDDSWSKDFRMPSFETLYC